MPHPPSASQSATTTSTSQRTPALRIRPYRPGDEGALQSVFYSAIHTTAARDYTSDQLEAWAPTMVDRELLQQWQRRMQRIAPYVVEVSETVAAYADLQASGYIDHFFVAGLFARRGIGTALMDFILTEADARGISRLSADVSLTAQPFFERAGFQIVEHRIRTIRGVALANAFMQREGAV